MASDDEFDLLSEEAAPPVRARKLKRLKKAIRVSEDPLLDGSESGQVKSSEFEALGVEESNEPSRLMELERLGVEGEINSDIDGCDGEGESNSALDWLGTGGELNSGLDGFGGEGGLNSGSDGLGAEGQMNSDLDVCGGEGELNSALDGLGAGGELNSGLDGFGGEGGLNSGSDGLGAEGQMNCGLDGVGAEGEMRSGFDGSVGGGETNSGVDSSAGVGGMNSGFDGMGGKGELNSCFYGLGGLEDGSGAKRVLDFESVGEEFGEKGEGQNEEVPEEGRDMRMEETDKKRRSSDGFEEEKAKKKSKRAKSGTTAAKSKGRTEKERRDHLKELHAESQKLLRETRDAGFKPVPLVQKPISSVLEKIRKRKMELLQKCINTADSSANGMCMDESNDDEEHSIGENVSSQMDVDEEPKQKFRAPIDDTQELFSDSQTTDSKDDAPGSPLEEVFAPSILAMNLELDSAPPIDISETSDDEDENEKENIDPHSPGGADLPSSLIGDPVKGFLDDEAEEEDDSDHDLLRFEDSDEDDGDPTEFNDMIATGFEERPIDGERRNELHQKWLEQQDASGTEKLMQKFKLGSKPKEPTLLEEKDADGESDSDGEEDAYGEKDAYGKEDSDGDEDADANNNPKSVFMTLRQIKQTIPLMFTDKDDVYMSSDDDDETEKRLAKQCLSDKAEEQATFLSPEEDESSKEVFGLIKRLNIVPDTKKPKTSAFAHMLPVGGDKGISSKSSFLGRGSNHSLPSSRKQGFSRSIIFGRSTISMSEDSSDMIERENNLPTNTTLAKLSTSKGNPCNQKSSSAEAGLRTDPSAEAVARTNKSASTEVVRTDKSASAGGDDVSSPSLIEILRQSSLHSKRCTEETLIGQIQIESVLSSFNVGRKRKSVQITRS